MAPCLLTSKKALNSAICRPGRPFAKIKVVRGTFCSQSADFLLSFLLFFCSGISGLQRTFSEQILENKVVLIMKKGTAVNSRARD